jgi:hypothetical protein
MDYDTIMWPRADLARYNAPDAAHIAGCFMGGLDYSIYGTIRRKTVHLYSTAALKR